MKIIIDIDENVFIRLFDNGVDISSEDREIIDRAIRNSKPYEERLIGHWIKDCDSCDCSHCYDSGARFTRKDCSGRCSNCGELQCCTDNFCPNCGANMRVKRGNNEIRWTDKLSVISNGDIIDFEGRVVGHINLESENEKL